MTTELTTQQPMDFGAMLKSAIDRPEAVAAVKELVTLYREEQDRLARREFAEAFRVWQKTHPVVVKNRKKGAVTDSGGKTPYSFADLDHIVSTLKDSLSDAGFSYAWTDPKFTEREVTLSCRLTHVGGHCELVPVTMPYTGTSMTNDAQKRGIAIAYAQRYSLISALGLTSCETDKDGGEVPGEHVTEEQAMDIETLLAEINASAESRSKLLAALKCASVATIAASDFERAKSMIAAAKRAKEARGS